MASWITAVGHFTLVAVSYSTPRGSHQTGARLAHNWVFDICQDRQNIDVDYDEVGALPISYG